MDWSTRWGSTITAVVMLTSCGPLGRDCTQEGCFSAFVIRFDGFDNHAAGRFEISGSAEGIPFQRDWTQTPRGDALVERCPAPGVLLVTRTLEGSRLVVTGVEFITTPARVELEVTRDGERLASRSYEPEYETLTPNGPDCGLTCEQASDVLDFGVSE